ncbi:ATP-binding protein [Nocardia sp. BMG111209]|uniref:ATP-binding protein n=1 Tax=Nocardia sp. BMG111209 TaxID=1160137 RepID=UPI0018CB0410|nr:ATP-binding protein [Nocardia sp. BMG111209]
MEVYVECEVLEVRLRLAPATDASPLETLVLRAIDPDPHGAGPQEQRRGVDTYLELAQMFGLTPRMMIDLLGDLWRAQRVGIDFGAQPERIRLTEKARAELGQLSERDFLSSSSRSSDTQKILLETLTGAVLPIGAARWRARHAGLKVPRSSLDKRPRDIERHELAAAVQRNLERIDDRAPSRVADVHLVPDPQRTGNPIQYFALTVKAGIDHRGRLLVQVEDRALTRTAQREATARLQQLIEDDPTHNFVKTLRGQATPIHEPLERVDLQLAALQRSIAGLAATEPAHRQSEHDRVAAAATLLGIEIADMAARQTRVVAIRTTDEHRAEICAMLESARQQVVFVVPWIRYNGLAPFVETITAAVARGVHIVILWGIDRNRGTLENNVLNALDGIERAARASGAGGALHYDRGLPSHVHAKLVIADDRRFLVTSKNFFTASELAEFGVAATALDDTLAPLAADVLRWARDATPSPQVAEAIVTDHRMFGNRAPYPAPALSLPRADATLLAAAPGSAELRVWASAWQTTGEYLGDLLTGLLPVASLVTDGLHRTLMWEALRNAAARVVICSDRLSPDIVTDDFIDEVNRCVARGTDVTIVYRRFPDTEQERGRHQAGILADLAGNRGTGRGRLLIRCDEDSHAKVLVTDDLVVVGSYNYLSFEATYRSGRRRQRSEVSLQLYSPTMALAIAAMVEDGTPGIPAPATEPHAPTIPVDSLRANELLVALAAAPRSAAGAKPPDSAEIATRVRTIASLCRSGTTEFAIATVLAEAGADPRTLERLYAAVVSELAVDDISHDGWCIRLVDILWRRGNWVAAHVVRTAIDSETVVPRRSVTALAAAHRSTGCPPLLAETALTEAATPAEVTALSIWAAATYLDTGHSVLRDGAELLLEMVAPAARAFIELALESVAAMGLLPRQALADRTSVEARQAESERAWLTLGEAIRAFRQAQHSCVQERMTKSYLLEPGGQISMLELLADSRDPVATRGWLADNGGERGQWLDKSTRESGSHHLINGRSRRVMLTKVGDIFHAAEIATAAELQPEPEQAFTAAWLAAAPRLRDAARAARAELSADIENHLAAAALDDLLDVVSPAPGPAPGAVRPESWRYPGLLVAEVSESPTPRRRARALALDLYRAWTPDSAIAWLIESGEFFTADELIDQISTSATATETKALRDRVAAERIRAVERVSARCRELLARYDRAGIPEPALPDFREALDLRVADTAARLDALEHALGQAERAAGEALSARLRLRATEIPALRARHITELISAGELRIARDVLDGTGDGPVVPLHVTERQWRWPNLSLDQVVGTLTQPLVRRPGTEIFVPAADDTAARRFLDALAALAAGAPDATAAYVGAVQGLIARVDVGPVITETGGRRYGTLMLPDLPHLPHLAFVERTGVPVVIGSPPGDGGVRICLSLRLSEPVHRGSGVAVIDISSTLSLLAAGDDGKSRDRSDRVIAFLRTICTQLAFDDVVEPAALAYATVDELRPRLWWLLYLLSVAQAPTVLDGLLEISGGHPEPLWQILRDEIARVHHHGDRFGLERIREHLGEIALGAVRRDIDDDAATATLLVMIAYQVFDEQGIRDGVVVILQELNSPISVDAVIDIDAALERLRHRRYLRPGGAGDTAPGSCGCGIVRSLARSNPIASAERIIAQLVAAHDNDRQRRAKDAMRRRAAIGYLHERGRPAIGAVDDARSDVEVNRRLNLEDRWYSPTVVDVHAEAVKVCARLDDSATQVDILLSPESSPPARVFLPPLAVVLLVENLAKNAAEAAAANASAAEADRGTVSIGIAVDGRSRRVVIDVGDSGDGVPAAVRESLERGETPLSTKHSGHGVGLAEVRTTIEDHGGELTLLPDRSRWGGAHFRATLPLYLRGAG